MRGEHAHQSVNYEMMGNDLSLTLEPSNLNCHFGFDTHTLVAALAFSDDANGGHYLGPTSPCIDKATDLGFHADLDGNLTPQGASPDIGAYELEEVRR